MGRNEERRQEGSRKRDGVIEGKRTKKKKKRETKTSAQRKERKKKWKVKHHWDAEIIYKKKETTKEKEECIRGERKRKNEITVKRTKPWIKQNTAGIYEF